MKRLLKLLGLTGLMATGTACGTRAESFKDISTEEAEHLIKEPGTFLLDVRTAEEYAAERLAKATLVPVQVLASQLDKLPKDKERPILLYCRSGHRSGVAADLLAKQGYKKLYNMRGGIMAWSSEGRRVETGPQ